MSGTVFAAACWRPFSWRELANRAMAQQAAKTQGFPTAEAAASALTEAVRKGDDKTIAAMLGEWWRVFVPNRERDFGHERALYLAAWDDSHKVTIDGDKAIVEVGKTGWTLPIPSSRTARNGASTPRPVSTSWARERSAATSWAPSRPCWPSSTPSASMPQRTR